MKQSEPQQISQLLQTSIIIIDEALRISWVNSASEALLTASLRRLRGLKLLECFDCDELTEQILEHSFQQKRQWQITEASIHTTTQHWHNCQLLLSYHVIDARPFVILEITAPNEQLHSRKEHQLLDQNKVSLSLVRNLAHEIKNPLSGLRGAAQLLSRKLPDELTRFTEVIVSEADRLQALVDRMLTPAKPEPSIECNIHAITEKAAQFVALQEHKNLRLVKDYDPSLPELNIAIEQVYQALLNLITNAIEAINAEGQLTIKTRAVHQHSIGDRQYKLMARIDVIDDGPGVASELEDVIFFPTISGKQSSGLGLSIAQSLIRQNNGLIEYLPQPVGSCFSIYLPIPEKA
ncbi:MAG: nitrogen regulation protein NR(II) [Kangiellaceae bacterium]|jgi:two-component system nitrogen regulation sensor histidine kinase GlnL|nr:nitrogen regulation protein NR(II) [Kangiellaceae bacterium]